MMVERIKVAIQQLQEPDQLALAAWLDERMEQAWDRQIEQDFSPGERGSALLEKVNRDIDAGEFTPLADGLRTRRES